MLYRFANIHFHHDICAQKMRLKWLNHSDYAIVHYTIFDPRPLPTASGPLRVHSKPDIERLDWLEGFLTQQLPELKLETSIPDFLREIAGQYIVCYLIRCTRLALLRGLF